MQLLTEKLKEHSVDYKIIEDDSRELQTISIFFPSSFKTLFVHIETDIHQQKGELHISFIDQPKAIDFYTIQLKDWDIFLKIARKKGRFVYIPKRLIRYRIHDGSTTKQFIVDNKRKEEDNLVFNKIWPKFITKMLMKI